MTRAAVVLWCGVIGWPVICDGQSAGPVETQWRGVDFHIDQTIVLQVEYLRGRLVPVHPGQVPWFDDKKSFVMAIDTARITLSAQDIGDLLNRYVFSYRGAPLHALRVAITDGKVQQRGRLNGFPFTVTSDVEVTPVGELRLRTTSIRAMGIPVKHVMGAVGLTLEKLVDLSKARGVRAKGNDLILSPTEIMPFPHMQGRLTAVQLADNAMVEIFRSTDGEERAVAPAPLEVPDSAAVNYMYFRGGILRFGRLTMTPADLLIIDLDPANPFDFFLDRYPDQLVTGYSRNTRSGALITFLPDYRAVRRTAGRRAQR